MRGWIFKVFGGFFEKEFLIVLFFGSWWGRYFEPIFCSTAKPFVLYNTRCYKSIDYDNLWRCQGDPIYPLENRGSFNLYRSFAEPQIFNLDQDAVLPAGEQFHEGQLNISLFWLEEDLELLFFPLFLILCA